ncbi:hypothetical protein BK131_20075 [Paenibacillus amylolyticus]|uniref:HEPN domain-containing protein n=1 Tax=Paenibacillus amylolyticus TaxID=1451 RepID=A0A1R1BPQ0_PAEAM|nr:hypothetical protein [Paenibacillus amylolyticus]OMF11774.1 hypothetical protein BK131_20075 [Paenibacillus amylolyticus]
MYHAYSYKNRQNNEFVNGIDDKLSDVKKDVFEYQRLSQYHINLAAIMRDHNQFKACLILCDWALASMIKALYIHSYHSMHPPKELTMNVILPLVHTDAEPGLDIALFIGTMQHMSSLADCPYDQPLELNNIERLFRRTDEIVDELTTRLINDSTE